MQIRNSEFGIQNPNPTPSTRETRTPQQKLFKITLWGSRLGRRVGGW